MAEIDKALPNEVTQTVEIASPEDSLQEVIDTQELTSRSREHGNYRNQRRWSRNKF
jgi:hypothetical protein